MSAPEPHFPGDWPTTPADELAPSSSLGAQEALDDIAADDSVLQRAEHALVDAAHGLVATVSHLAGIDLAADGLDDLTRNLHPSTHDTDTDETDAIAKTQADLAASPAQRLVRDNDGAAVGSALLAGAAGAKIAENEVREPAADDNELERKGLVEPHEPAPTAIPAPDFGTPAIEKEQAALAASPAQQLLRADSSVRADEAALLAGAAGAKVGGTREVEEPAKAPLDVAVEKAVEAGAGVPSPTKTTSEGPHAVPLEREVSTPLPLVDTPPSPRATPVEDRPSLPMPHGSTTSFTADVLAAGEGIETPLEAPGPAAAGFGIREHGDIIATDRELDENVATPKLSNKVALPHSSSDINLSKTGSNDDQSRAERHVDDEARVVHNPSPLTAGAAVGSIAGAALGSELAQRNTPQDFAPYTPPIVEPTQGQAELQHAAAVPVPDTPSMELQQAVAVPIPDTPATEQPPPASSGKPLSPAVFGASAPLPLPLAGSDGRVQTREGDVVPATVNAQNVKDEVAAPAVGERDGTTTPGSEKIPMETALDEGPAEKRKDKGKGKEVLGAAALGTAGVGAGVGMRDLLEGDKDGDARTAHSNTSDRHLDSATSAAPLSTDSTLDSTLDDPFLSKPDPLSEQRAFPTIPHMNMRPTDEAVFDAAVGDGEAARRARVLDPHELARANAPTSPEQAGFANVTEVTPAMRDFAHLSTPAPQAVDHALAEAPAVGGAEPEPREEAADTGRHSNVPLVAGAGLAGIGAGAVGAGIVARDHAASTQQAPVANAIGTGTPAGAAAPPATAYAQPPATSASTAPVGAASAHPAPHAAAEKRTPVSRFTEEAFYPSSTGMDTPSSTRAVMGSPPSSVRDRSAAVTPVQATTPTQSLFEAGILEKSPHLKIQTHKVDGHKRLHRKSLSGVVTPASGGSLSRHSRESPRQSPRQSVDVDRSGPPAARHSPAFTEGRRDRMLDDMVGVPDPTVGGYDSPRTSPASAASSPRHSVHVAAQPVSGGGGGVAQTYPGAPPTSHVAATYGPGAAAGAIPSGVPQASHPQPHAQQHVQQPVQQHAAPAPAPAPTTAAAQSQIQNQSGATVGRKLSKKHHAPGTPEKSGFFSRMFGSGSKAAQ
ncbi:hypothetical protein JCM3770_000573 [Rhodotorula araucariae]